MQNLIPQVAAALSAGQPQQAEQLCRAALIEQPRDESLLLLLAMSLQAQQRLSEALPVYAELTRLFPTGSLHWNNYATVMVDAGMPEEARAAYAKAIQLDPGNVLPRSQLGLLLIELQDYLGARTVLLEALALAPESIEGRINAARACCHCQDDEGADGLLKPWPTWLPMHNDELQVSLAQVLTLNSDIPPAAELLEDVIARQPGHLDARLLLANLYERLNRLTDAEAMLSPVMEPGAGASAVQRNEGDHLLASLALRRKDFARARQLLEQSGPQGDDDYVHYFQLAAVCDKQGDTEMAMRALHEAHRLEARERRIDSPEYFTPLSPAMPVDAPGVTAEQYPNWPQFIAPEAHDSPIFVVGFPRSGTTMLEQMLDAHPGLQSMDENPFFNRLATTLRNHDPRILEDLSVLRQYDCDELRKLYYKMVAERILRREGTRLVDKNPLNMQWLPMIYRLFPEAKFILALRHPCDVILSCYMQSFRSRGLAAACSTLDRLAHAYVETMTRWLEQVSVLQPTLLVSRYENLVADFPQQTARIAQFLGLDDASAMLRFDHHARNKAFIGTPSYSQVIEPVNRKGLGRWHNYRREFEPLLPILEPMLLHWEYSTDASA
ncbi:tetratricopeptide repeat-containing sulfotransferase family protein [Dyella humicola]|uniref:tetratricopeptide repeat-containing sulfotransferase family protein n=1 Tax=Dyella humicola TaxID=2992126 RepID=UPI00224F3EB8|nr:tetratricopeptide repeat-containing sulfotransferase family protein [Dyella humicola]